MKFVIYLFVFTLVSLMLFADGVQPVGDGTENNPYLIATLDNLLWLSTTPDVWDDNAYFLQTADIDASATENWNDGQGWDPIGNSIFSGIPFSGNYNGQMNTISNLYINRPDEEYVGFFGNLNWANLQNIKIENITSIGSGGVGGLIGYIEQEVSVFNCSSSGIIEGNLNVGGLIGYIYDYSTVTNCFSLSDIVGNDQVGGLVGQIEIPISNINNCFYDYESVLINGNHIITYGALNTVMFEDWINNDLVLDINDYFALDNNNYLISELDDFQTLLAFCYTDDISFLLTDDFDFAALSNFYFPCFKGNLNGQNHKIFNIDINRSNEDLVGLFGYLLNSTISNLGLENVTITGNDFVGGLTGKSFSSSVSNCYCSGNIQGNSSVGGLIGRCNNTNGINNHFVGSVSGNYSAVGGLIGYHYNSTITYCFSNVTISADTQVGGLVGWAQNSNILKCYSFCEMCNPNLNAGNLVGLNSDNSSILNSFSFGSILATSGGQIGGLVGWNFLNSVIDKCYSCTELLNSEVAAGLVGLNSNNSTVLNSFWDIETSGQINSEGGTGKTTEEMKSIATYTSLETLGLSAPWDFIDNPFEDTGNEDIWAIHQETNNGYPYLMGLEPVEVNEQLIINNSKLIISNFPNPFSLSNTSRSQATTISFTINESTKNTKLEIFNIKGQKVKELLNEILPAGEHQVSWNGKDEQNKTVSSGVYFIRLLTSGKEMTHKMMVLK